MFVFIDSSSLICHIMCSNNIITKNNELSTAWVRYANTWSSFSTEIDAGVSELCWDDVEVTCDGCKAAHWRHAESRFRIIVAVVDQVVSTLSNARIGRHTQTVVPLKNWITDITATLKRHRWALYDCCV